MSNDIKRAFDEVHASKELKNNTKTKISEALYQENPRRRPLVWVKPIVAAAALLLLTTGIYTYQSPIATVSVEASSLDVEFAVNRFNHVIDVEGVDVEQYRYKNYEDAIDLMMDHMEDEAIITVVSDRAERASQMRGRMMEMGRRHHTEGHPMGMHINQASTETWERAQASGLGVAKQEIYDQLIAEGREITTEEVMQMTINELVNLLENPESLEIENQHMPHHSMPMSEIHSDLNSQSNTRPHQKNRSPGSMMKHGKR